MTQDEYEDYIDIKNEVAMQKDQIDFINNNPEGLTKEGCEQSIRDWKSSNNKVVQKMYDEMLVRCKVFTNSGTMDDGSPILARDDKGKPTWVKKLKKE